MSDAPAETTRAEAPDLSHEALEKLARRLATPEPYKHPLQIAAEVPLPIEREGRLGDVLLILGQGDYPMFGHVADETRRLQDQAAAALRALTAERDALQAELERFRESPPYVMGHLQGWADALEQAEEVAREFSWMLPLHSSDAINEATDDAACAVAKQIADAIAALAAPQEPGTGGGAAQSRGASDA